MTRAELKTFTEELLGGTTLNDTVFDTLLNTAKNRREGLRNWRKLVREDSSKTALSSDTYTTTKALPTDFRKCVGKNPVVLKTGEDVLKYTQVPFNRRHEERDAAQKFYVDIYNSTFALTGSVSKTYTIYLYYLAKSPEISASQDWIFPSEYHSILAFDVAAMQKGGIDYDDINARMAPENKAQAALVWDAMVEWDDALQRAEFNV